LAEKNAKYLLGQVERVLPVAIGLFRVLGWLRRRLFLFLYCIY
jgi:hypothetical protein